MKPDDETDGPPIASEEFLQLITRSQRSVYLFILAMVGNVHQAEEILQETNLVVWAKMSQYQVGTNFLAWVKQIARFEMMKNRQRQRRDKLKFSDEFMLAVSEEVEAISGEEQARQDALILCLQKLSEQDRLLIEQRYQPGMTGRDVAEQLGRPSNSVYQSVGRIRKALLDCVERRLKVLSAFPT